jgi:hypothetical protein
MLRTLIICGLVIGFLLSCKENREMPADVPVQNEISQSELLFDSTLYKWENDKILVNWKDLLEVTFVRQAHPLLDSADIPQFTQKVSAMHGKKVIIEGFYIPVEETGDENIVILSAYPYAQCFFCGQAGVESIIDVLIDEKLPRIKTDTKVRFSGTFKVNPDNFDFLIYILEDASFMPE